MGTYTSVAVVRTGCPDIKAAMEDDLTVSAWITDAELDVDADLSSIAAPATLRALSPIPNTLARLATYLSRHRAYLLHYQNVGNGEEGALQAYWRDRYKETLQDVIDGRASVTSNSPTVGTLSMNKTADDKEIVYTTDGEGLCLP